MFTDNTTLDALSASDATATSTYPPETPNHTSEQTEDNILQRFQVERDLYYKETKRLRSVPGIEAITEYSKRYPLYDKLVDDQLAQLIAMGIYPDPQYYDDEDRKRIKEKLKSRTLPPCPPGVDKLFEDTRQPKTVENKPNVVKEVSRFAGRWIDEYESMPELKYWDSDMLLPRIPGGAVMLVHGMWGAHKTNMVLKWCMDMMLTHGARICYCAGEGDFGIGKLRMPAHCAKAGIETKELRDKFLLVDTIPILSNDRQVDEFIEAHRDYKPDVVVIDTLATATTGLNLTDEAVSSLLCGSGAAGRIQKAFGCLVIIPCHEGYGAPGRTKGSSNIPGNAYAMLGVSFDEEGRVITVVCNKMKDGPAKHSVIYSVNPSGVPIPERIAFIPADETAQNREKGKKAVPFHEHVEAELQKLTKGKGYVARKKLIDSLVEALDKKESAIAKALTRGVNDLTLTRFKLGEYWTLDKTLKTDEVFDSLHNRKNSAYIDQLKHVHRSIIGDRVEQEDSQKTEKNSQGHFFTQGVHNGSPYLMNAEGHSQGQQDTRGLKDEENCHGHVPESNVPDVLET